MTVSKKYLLTAFIALLCFNAAKAQSPTPADSSQAKPIINNYLEKIIKDTTSAKDNSVQPIDMNMRERRITNNSADSVNKMVPQEKLPLKKQD